MLFPTIDFAIFFVAVFCLNWALRPHYVAWRVFIIAASFVFYGWWEPRFTLLLAASIAGNYAFARLLAWRMGPGQLKTASARWVLAAAVAMNLGFLGWFKYYGFFVTDVVARLHDLGIGVSLPLVQVALPIGISFFTFQAISYVVDTWRGTVRPLPFLDFAAYLSFFPHLVAGPIVRASEFAPQMHPPGGPPRVEASHAFLLILGGLFKKVVISSYLASEIVDPVFGVPGQHSSPEILVAVYAYAIQIFADFSGYTDIAIGIALLLGFRFPQNFDAPYSARSLQDFWRRWHMTLSRWLRDYLYIPLGGNRGSSLFTARNLFLTMLLGGLWHGAAWTFIAWGAIHGSFLVFERAARGAWTRLGLPALPIRGLAVVEWVITFHVVCLAWVFFRAESMTVAWQLLRRLSTAGGESPLLSPLLLATVAGMLAWQFAPRLRLGGLEASFGRLSPLAQGAALGAGLFAIGALGPSGVAPFIYFRF